MEEISTLWVYLDGTREVVKLLGAKRAGEKAAEFWGKNIHRAEKEKVN